MNPRAEVWITGVGAGTPLGHSFPAAADSLLAGRSGIRPITAFEVSDHPSRIAGMLADIPTPPGFDAAAFARLERLEQLHLWCAVSALRDAGWWDRRGEVRIGLVLGLGAEWMRYWEMDYNQGGRRMFETEPDQAALVESVQRRLDLHGPTLAVAAACASGNFALDQARRLLRLGWADVCVAGACDLSVTSMSLSGFGNLRALSRRNADPAGASRPFDRDRDGFVMAEGGVLFVLEPAETARRRGARPYAELAGCGASSDAFHMVIPGNDPTHAIQAMRASLIDAELNPGDVDYVNAHATSTSVGDVAETRALQAVLGEAAAHVPVSSTKSMSGHLLTGASAFEALACLAALDRQAAPPTINLDHLDPECQLCHVPNQAQERPVRVAISNSFGFGGSNISVVLRKVA
jgi:3-oxoacyl-[acyl-carrier-protein] synthase II